VYGVNFSGGDNRTHGQIERTERIDSFEAAQVDGWGTLFTSGMIPLNCGHFMGSDREAVELLRGQWLNTLELARIPSGFGGSRAFWLCPHCGRRARFLYFKKLGFVCRSCAKLNYQCQQRTRDSTNHAHDGLRLAREKLGWVPPFPVCPADFSHIVPPRPKGMHETTYYRYLVRYRRYQEKYRRDSMREMMRILRRR